MKILPPPPRAATPPRGTILFFTGWGMDPAATRHLSPEGYDLWTFWDYTDLPAAPPPPPPEAGECVLVAWSLGVWAAARLDWSAWRLRTGLALNGTLEPESAEWGIPPRIFQGTAENWGLPRARERFLARMTGSAQAASEFPRGARTPEDQQTELTAISRQCLAAPTPRPSPFTMAVVGAEDRIFPPEAQRNAWRREGVPVKELPAPHDCLRTFHSWEEVLRLG
ncbi:MAG: pimeloyl-ACP methyl esterase BioG family protein [Oligosphaeraceae bacterium]